MISLSIGKLVLDFENKKDQEVMGKILALVENSNLRSIFKKNGFSHDFINQLVDCTTVQFLYNLYIKERMEEMNSSSIRITDLKMIDKHADFIDSLEKFYTNTSEHPVEINEFTDFIDKSDENMMKDIEIIKFIIFLINQNGVSDKIWNLVEGNRAKQIIVATNLAIKYIVACSEGQNELSLVSILTKQAIIADLINDALIMPNISDTK